MLEKFYSSFELQRTKEEAAKSSFAEGKKCFLSDCGVEDLGNRRNRAFRRFIRDYSDINCYKSSILICDFDGIVNGEEICNDPNYASYDDVQTFIKNHRFDFEKNGIVNMAICRSNSTVKNFNKFHLYIELDHFYKFDNKTDGIKNPLDLLYGPEEYAKVRELFSDSFIELSDPDDHSLSRINQVIYSEFSDIYYEDFAKFGGMVNETSVETVLKTVNTDKALETNQQVSSHFVEIYNDKGYYKDNLDRYIMPFPRNAYERNKKFGYSEENYQHFGYMPLSVQHVAAKKRNGQQNRSKWCTKSAIRNTAVALFSLAFCKQNYNAFIPDEDRNLNEPVPYIPIITLDNIWRNIFMQTVNCMIFEVSGWSEQETKYRKIIAETIDECLEGVVNFSPRTWHDFMLRTIRGFEVNSLVKVKENAYNPRNKKDSVLSELCKLNFINRIYDSTFEAYVVGYKFAHYEDFEILKTNIEAILTKHHSNWESFLRWTTVIDKETGEVRKLEIPRKKRAANKTLSNNEQILSECAKNGETYLIPKDKVTGALRKYLSKHKLKYKSV